MGKHSGRITSTDVGYGLAYAEGEYGVDLNPVLLYVLASTVYNIWSPNRKKRSLDDIKSEVIERAFRVELKRNPDTEQVKNGAEAYSAAIGKMFNNFKNVLRPNFSPTTRVGTKKERKPHLVTEATGQRRVAL